MQAQSHWLKDGRLHFQHGPIDIVIGAEGDARIVQKAHQNAWERFSGLLQELVDELPALRTNIDTACMLRGCVARRMWIAAQVHRPAFVTPMVAVAGAVAQELILAYEKPGIDRAWVNNGGDIALHLSPGTSVRVGVYAQIDRLARLDETGSLEVDGAFNVSYESGVRGIATSGWRGRSFSLGIADSVTVLAQTAAQADAAASLIGNAVNINAAGIVRLPANQLKDDSDLGDIPVTVNVPELSADQAAQALREGHKKALVLHATGHIHACFISCQGWTISTENHSDEPQPLDTPYNTNARDRRVRALELH